MPCWRIRPNKRRSSFSPTLKLGRASRTSEDRARRRRRYPTSQPVTIVLVSVNCGGAWTRTKD
eukprot:scaffold77298_cov63-Phaeocystis_antarctica.AAC.2